jgi:molybdopterin/thiamine biosynthesis adenylyltransferase
MSYDAVFSRERLAGYDQSILDESLLIVGGGALGAALTYVLCMWGFRNATIVDPDTYDTSNATRTLDFPWDRVRARMPVHKATELASHWRRRLRSAGVDPDVRGVRSFVQELAPSDWRTAKVVLAAVDHPRARLDTAVLARRYGKPLIMGGFDGDTGQSTVFFIEPTADACRACPLETLPTYAAADVSCAGFGRREMEQRKLPATATLASLTASLMIDVLTELLMGRTDGPTAKVLRTDLRGAWRREFVSPANWFALQPNPDCLHHHPGDITRIRVRGSRLTNLVRTVDAVSPGASVRLVGGIVVNTLDAEGRLVRVALPSWRVPPGLPGGAFPMADPSEPAIVLDELTPIVVDAYRLGDIPLNQLGLQSGALFLVTDSTGQTALYEHI